MKKDKQKQNASAPEIVESEVLANESGEEIVVAPVTADKTEKTSDKAKKQDKVVKKEKKESFFKKSGRKCREVGSELKKVSWPSFSKVVQKTGIVLAVVIFFFLVLLGIDKLLELLFKVLIGA